MRERKAITREKPAGKQEVAKWEEKKHRGRLLERKKNQYCRGKVLRGRVTSHQKAAGKKAFPKPSHPSPETGGRRNWGARKKKKVKEGGPARTARGDL